jgi:hypothetical protein
MLIKLFQLTVFTAVIFSNIKYNWAWGTSPLAVAVVALFAAWIATAIPFAIIDLSTKLKALLLRCHQGIKNSRITRA